MKINLLFCWQFVICGFAVLGPLQVQIKIWNYERIRKLTYLCAVVVSVFKL